MTAVAAKRYRIEIDNFHQILTAFSITLPVPDSRLLRLPGRGSQPGRGQRPPGHGGGGPQRLLPPHREAPLDAPHRRGPGRRQGIRVPAREAWTLQVSGNGTARGCVFSHLTRRKALSDVL